MSIQECLVILIVALIVLGPNQLQTIARAYGKIIKVIRDFSFKAQEVVDKQILEAELEENQKKAEVADKIYEKRKNY